MKIERVWPMARTLVIPVAVALTVAGWAANVSAGSASNAKRPRRVTEPNGSSPQEIPGYGQPPKELTSFNYGNHSLWIALYWSRSGIVARPAADPGPVEAIIQPDGSIHTKIGWYRGVSDKLTVRGRRLDAFAPPLRASVPDGYTSRGFQPTGIIFPTAGCWRVTGRVGRASLTFVVRVVEKR